jgi:uncharacterized protein YjbI with pentapeptide repeats
MSDKILRRLKFGSAAWNAWRRENAGAAIALDGAALDGMILIGIDFSHVSLRGASLHATNLMNADLRHADFTGANLEEADLIAANLAGGDSHRLQDARDRFAGCEPRQRPVHG